MTASFFKTLQKIKEIPASYEIQGDITIFCFLKLVRLQSDQGRFLATAGIRKHADATLPKGARITIKSKNLGDPENRLMYICRVEEMEKRGDIVVHHLKLMDTVDLEYHREHARTELEIDALRNNDIRFKTSNISEGGIQFYYNSTLTSAVLNQTMHIQMLIDGQLQPFECVPRYIHYNWWEQRHQVGAKFINISDSQKALIKRLMDSGADVDIALPEDDPPLETASFDQGASEPEPEAIIASDEPAASEAIVGSGTKTASKKTFIDPESGRIRFDK